MTMEVLLVLQHQSKTVGFEKLGKWKRHLSRKQRQPHKTLISFCNPIFNFQIKNGREFSLAHHLILMTLYCSSAFFTRGSNTEYIAAIFFSASSRGIWKAARFCWIFSASGTGGAPSKAQLWGMGDRVSAMITHNRTDKAPGIFIVKENWFRAQRRERIPELSRVIVLRT